MKRREFSTALVRGSLAAGALAGGMPLAGAQGGAPVAGKDYVVINPPVATPANGKIEVVEFFWYGCPHCNVFEPMLEAWAKKLPADVSFRRVPVAFRDEPFGTHQRIYYALETLNQVEAMHRKVFYAIHNDRQKLDKPADIAAFMTKNGLDGAKFVEVMNSFGVQTKARRARQLAEAYQVDGVRALGVRGRFYTSGSLAGSPEQSLRVTDFLIERSRKA